MSDNQENTDTEDTTAPRRATLPLRPPCERLSCHKSSVCSRSYFVVVMVFFHVYIINVIGLLFYVHYNSGQDDHTRNHDAPSGDQQRPEAQRPPSKAEFLRDVSLTRIEGIRVSDVMMQQCHYNIHSFFRSRTHIDHLLITSPTYLSGRTCPEGVISAR